MKHTLKKLYITGCTGRTLPEEVEAPPIPGFKRKYPPQLSKEDLDELEKCERDFRKIFKIYMTSY